ncbi:PorP/SprF family type IX secretion system membrane protein [Pinibacter soli]|uniref:Type IX secretion system membrane protein PorP/SprF n=1 Tax=Pinibacter soli TaxID=3044211 RepID=A0ABT6RFW2_9BACT|nr:type IX secretion system membrane protein PorP/SprF [Pinibacter soli]MDI3321453.1 type IX secretion system membrane protein PorP/SprF [Pinibacter soli]
MKKNKFLGLIMGVATLMCAKTADAQQDAQFSQYMFNGLYINPAYAGYREQWNVNAFYRNQWTGFPGAPKTMSLAADGTVHDNRAGLGFQIVNDVLGAQTNTSVYGNYAYRIPLGVNEYEGKTLSLGFGIGILQDRLNMSKLDPNQQGDPTIITAAKTKIMPDAKVGVFYNSDRFYIGASASNLITNSWNRKDDIKGVYVIPKLHWYFTAGGLVPLSDEVSWKPSFLLKDDLAGPTSLDVNSMFLFQKLLWLGASYRTAIPSFYNKSAFDKNLKKSADVVGLLELMVNEKLRIGYAYDYSLNATTTQRFSTHEISIGFFFANKKGAMLSPRYF